ncbi:hypothetical protein MMYC01_204300 [Madurella mycetomatis]|uniref:Synaptobrevin n=1 Tax=Madurella mycetomatis TaxID=100816 RepID=A0A175W680_9PEZI|nr:hypothetical protein MMYC01_204300 [Madurella mycetomatis]
MAQLIPGVMATPAVRHADPLTDLTLLLSRLQQTILHADAEREARLRASEYERAKARANINYARSLLTKLEQEALTVKIHARRHDAQADLVRKREVLDQLSERLSDLAEFAAAASHNEEEADTSDGEDILADIIVTPSESMDSTRSPNMAAQEPPDEESNQTPPPLESQQPTSAQPQAKAVPSENTEPEPPTTTTTTTLPPDPTTTSQSLRPRHAETSPTSPPQPSEPTASATTTSSSALFGSRSANQPPLPAATTTEAILDHQRAEQDALSESILKLASELKASSQAFSASLEEDKDLVDRAGQGMSKTGEGMEGVTRRMGVLQRMTEGEGWWGRMRLYAMVYGLMVVLVLLVGVAPKLRF